MTAPQGHRDARPQALPWWSSHRRLEESLSGMAFISIGTLAVFFGKLFFPPGNETAGFLASLALFGVGFSVR